jgi:hypothetical protein
MTATGTPMSRSARSRAGASRLAPRRLSWHRGRSVDEPGKTAPRALPEPWRQALPIVAFGRRQRRRSARVRSSATSPRRPRWCSSPSARMRAGQAPCRRVYEIRMRVGSLALHCVTSSLSAARTKRSDVAPSAALRRCGGRRSPTTPRRGAYGTRAALHAFDANLWPVGPGQKRSRWRGLRL